MMLSGSVQAPYSDRYPDYCYLLPLKPPPLTLRDVDPNRLDPLHEYPRDTAIYLPNLRTVELVDYEFTVGPTQDDGLAAIELVLKPNRYTMAKERRIVFSARATMAGMFAKRYLNEALRTAFGRALGAKP